MKNQFHINFLTKKFTSYQFFLLIIAAVWLVNGAYAKLLGKVPRHELIVKEILDVNDPKKLIIIIGILEIFMAIWIISNKHSKINALTQSALILLMNVLEQIYTPELLLWGKWNFVFALLFVFFIIWNEFYNRPNQLEK